MKANDYFEVAIRVIGVVLMIYGLRDLLDALLFVLGYFTIMDTNPKYYLVFGLGSLVLGFYFVRGAGLLVDFAFPNVDDDSPPTPGKTSDT
jgi:hypothetical protein